MELKPGDPVYLYSNGQLGTGEFRRYVDGGHKWWEILWEGNTIKCGVNGLFKASKHDALSIALAEIDGALNGNQREMDVLLLKRQDLEAERESIVRALKG